jgi:hypothetical protein
VLAAEELELDESRGQNQGAPDGPQAWRDNHAVAFGRLHP